MFQAKKKERLGLEIDIQAILGYYLFHKIVSFLLRLLKHALFHRGSCTPLRDKDIDSFKAISK